MPRIPRTPEIVAREALEKIVNCNINDLVKYCRFVDGLALEALIEIEHMEATSEFVKGTR